VDASHPTVADTAAAIRDGELDATGAVAAALARIELLDPALGAFSHVDAEAALAAAAATPAPGPGRPLAGVPIAVKASLPVAGRPFTHGSRFLEHVRAQQSAFLVQRLEEAGAIIVGMTKQPELAILPTTEPAFGGPAHNPWDLSRTPGGSSGGSAVAVAAGMVPAAHGSDGGGSLRTPAACCGVVGLKPSRGRISSGPGAGDSLLAAHGFLTRTVADQALLLDVAAGYEVGDATWAPPVGEAYSVLAARPTGPLRIAVSAANALGIEPDEEEVAALRRTAELLDGLGHRVVEAHLPQPPPETLDMFLRVYVTMVGTGVAALTRMVGREPEPGELEPLTLELAERARALSAVDLQLALAELNGIARRTVAFFADHDVLLTPVLAERPLPIGTLHGQGEDPFADFLRSATFAPYLPIVNVTGQPAMSVPAGLGRDGLPVGVHLVGRPLAEDTLLRLAAQLETAQPWAHMRPPGVAV
jgi:amidase